MEGPESVNELTSLDYYAIEELLTDDERAVRDRARRFVEEEVMPEVVSSHREAKFPEHLRGRMGGLGFFAPYLKEHGCAGLSYTAYGLIMQELERADSGLRSEASVQGALAIYAIHSFGTPEQHAHWLPGLVSGERVGCFALTELGHGSDPRTTTGVWADSSWRKILPHSARRILMGSLACACRARRSAGSKTAAYRQRIVCPRPRGCVRRCRVFRRRAWVLRGV